MRLVARLLAAWAMVSASTPVEAYLKLGASIDGRVVDVTWRAPVRYFVSDADGGVDGGGGVSEWDASPWCFNDGYGGSSGGPHSRPPRPRRCATASCATRPCRFDR